MGTLTKFTSGDLNLHGDTYIDLDDDVFVTDGSLAIEDDFFAAGNSQELFDCLNLSVRRSGRNAKRWQATTRFSSQA